MTDSINVPSVGFDSQLVVQRINTIPQTNEQNVSANGFNIVDAGNVRSWWRGWLIVKTWRRQRSADRLLTVNQLFHVIVTSPQVGPLVHRSCCGGGERPSPYTGDTRGTHGLLGSLFVRRGASVRRLAGGPPVLTGPGRAGVETFCFLAALLSLSGQRGCGRESVHFWGSHERRGPVSCCQQNTGNSCAHGL